VLDISNQNQLLVEQVESLKEEGDRLRADASKNAESYGKLQEVCENAVALLQVSKEGLKRKNKIISRLQEGARDILSELNEPASSTSNAS
jgi:FtsZ-binding cell division protein ZapB